MKKLLILLSFFTFNSFIQAQTGSSGTSDARSMGMAKTYNASAKGIFALEINPANLLLNTEEFLEISTLFPLPGISFKSGTNFISMNDFNYFFGGVDGKSRVLNEQDKVRLKELFANGGLVYASLNANLFSAAVKMNPKIGALAFSINDFAGGSISFPREVIDVALSGNSIGKEFVIKDEEIKSWWIRNYSISYAREISSNKKFFDQIIAGISLKVVHGYYYVGTERIDAQFKTDNNAAITGHADLLAYTSFSDNFGVQYDFEDKEKSYNKNGNFSPFMNPAGTGFGFDLGLSSRINKELTIALSITDIGDILWKKNTAKFISTGEIFLDDITSESQLDSIEERFTAEGAPAGEFSTSLPTALRVGAAYYFIPGSLLVAVDYNQGFNNLPGNSKNPRFSIGAEWKPMDWIPYLRSGISVGGLDGFGWAFGIGIDAGVLELNFATSDMNSFVSPNTANFISVAFDSRWKF